MTLETPLSSPSSSNRVVFKPPDLYNRCLQPFPRRQNHHKLNNKLIRDPLNPPPYGDPALPYGNITIQPSYPFTTTDNNTHIV